MLPVTQDGFDKLAADSKTPIKLLFIDQFGQEE